MATAWLWAWRDSASFTLRGDTACPCQVLPLFLFPYELLCVASFSCNQIISAYNNGHHLFSTDFSMQMPKHVENQFKMISCHLVIRTPNYKLITISVYKLIRIIITALKYVLLDFCLPSASSLFIISNLKT